MTRPKILLLIPSIASGGAERVMVHLFNHLSRDKFEIHLGILHMRDTTVDNFRKELEYLHNLNVPRARNAFIPLLRFVRQLKPDIVFSAMPALNLVVSMIRPFLSVSTKFIMRETSIPSIRNHDIPTFLYRFFYSHLVPKNDLVICQSVAMADDLKMFSKIPKKKLAIINNPIEFDKLSKSSISKEIFDVVLVAGLRAHKGIHRLIEAAQFLDPSISIGIIGSGPEWCKLQQMVLEKRLTQIKMIGYKSTPVSYMKAAKVVVQTSYYEGFSNVLLESLAVGTPVVAFDVLGGTREIIDHGYNGFLVENGDVVGFSEAIQKALTFDWNRHEIKSNAFKKYNISKIISEYEVAIQRIV